MAGVKNVVAVTLGLLGVSAAAGCVDRTPPPPDAPIPPRSAVVRQEDPPKPMPRPGEDDDTAAAGALPSPPFYDAPLVTQETPEQPAFVQAYNAVGRPRIVVFVNRTLEGELLPANAGDEPREADPFDSRDSRDGYLRTGQYDQVATRQIDYEAIENILTDWLAAGGRTEIVSPIAARKRLTGQQVDDLQSGRPRVMSDVAQALDADVLVHVSARPTRQSERGLYVRLVAEAINLGQGGQSIGRSVVDVPPPLDKPRINKFTRFLARGLMDRMTGTWENLPAPREDGRGRAAPRRSGDAVEDAVDEAVSPRGGDPRLERPQAPPPPGSPLLRSPPTPPVEPEAAPVPDSTPVEPAAPAPQETPAPPPAPPAEAERVDATAEPSDNK